MVYISLSATKVKKFLADSTPPVLKNVNFANTSLFRPLKPPKHTNRKCPPNKKKQNQAVYKWGDDTIGGSYLEANHNANIFTILNRGQRESFYPDFVP